MIRAGGQSAESRYGEQYDNTDLQNEIEALKGHINTVKLDQKRLERKRQHIAEQYGALNTQTH